LSTRGRGEGGSRDTAAKEEAKEEVSGEERPSRVRILALPEAGRFSDREGVVYGLSTPSKSGVSPVIGAESSDEDFALAVCFDDTDEVAWFAPHLVEHAPD
jgi:hypothetical protein